jgi:hypothetical protein
VERACRCYFGEPASAAPIPIIRFSARILSVAMIWIPAAHEVNRGGYLSGVQRRRFIYLGLGLLAIPAFFLTEILLTAGAGGVHITLVNALFLVGLLPLFGLTLGSLGIAAILEGAIGRCRTVAGLPSQYRWEANPRNRPFRSVRIDGQTVPFPAKDYETVVGRGQAVRIYRSRLFGGCLGWEYVNPSHGLTSPA